MKNIRYKQYQTRKKKKKEKERGFGSQKNWPYMDMEKYTANTEHHTMFKLQSAYFLSVNTILCKCTPIFI